MLFFLANDLQSFNKRFFYPERYSFDTRDADRIRAKALSDGIGRWGGLDRLLVENGPYHPVKRFSLLDLKVTVWRPAAPALLFTKGESWGSRLNNESRGDSEKRSSHSRRLGSLVT